MNSKLKRIYVPMTESGFYILFCLQQPQHGYGISQQVRQMTGGEVTISPGTMYGTLSKMEKDGLIRFVREEEKRKKVGRGSDVGGDWGDVKEQRERGGKGRAQEGKREARDQEANERGGDKQPLL